MNMNCKEASRLISQEEDGGLRFGQRTALRFHLLICTACTRARTHFAFMRRAAQQYPGPEDDGPPKA